MGKTTGFLEYPRQGPRHRPVPVRLRDWREVYETQSDDEVAVQGARCMDCGIPFCMQGCPLGNRIPTFNDHVYRSHWDQAAEQLFDTNNFPEFTGRLCPAPCESACVLGISDSRDPHREARGGRWFRTGRTGGRGPARERGPPRPRL